MLEFHTEKKRRVCKKCGRPLPSSWLDPLCESCADNELYQEVKEYILKNDVTEFEVASHFDISLEKVRKWIKEGYIEYGLDKPNDLT